MGKNRFWSDSEVQMGVFGCRIFLVPELHLNLGSNSNPPTQTVSRARKLSGWGSFRCQLPHDTASLSQECLERTSRAEDEELKDGDPPSSWLQKDLQL